MKIVWQWLLAIVLYALFSAGAADLWPMLAHIHHNDHRVPAGIELAMNGVLIPLGVGFLIALFVRRELLGTPWPLLLAPFLLHLATGYVTDSFYSPYSTELLSLVGSGAIQGATALLGWLVYGWLHGRRIASPRGQAATVTALR